MLNGCEHYGWGATFPALVMRNLIGFREIGNPLPGEVTPPPPDRDGFILAPALPPSMFAVGRTYGITNLRGFGVRVDVHYTVKAEGRLDVRLDWAADDGGALRLSVRDAAGRVVAEAGGAAARGALSFAAENGALYYVTWEGPS
ncbi:MAG: hypothetical protein M5R40_05585 [Anaerolineae bacterium]|nr:hypothetical protein [Anaerolineae bacterium]